MDKLTMSSQCVLVKKVSDIVGCILSTETNLRKKRKFTFPIRKIVISQAKGILTRLLEAKAAITAIIGQSVLGRQQSLQQSFPSYSMKLPNSESKLSFLSQIIIY